MDDEEMKSWHLVEYLMRFLILPLTIYARGRIEIKNETSDQNKKIKAM
jgi:hypothetical protein